MMRQANLKMAQSKTLTLNLGLKVSRFYYVSYSVKSCHANDEETFQLIFNSA